MLNERSNAKKGAKPACVTRVDEQSSRRLTAASVALLSTGEGTGGSLVTTRLSRFPPFMGGWQQLWISLRVSPAGNPDQPSVKIAHSLKK
jgi:hypothetical protein